MNLGSGLESISTNNWTGVCDVFVDCPKLASLNVSADNANFASEDGVLYNKDMSEIVAFPKGKTGEYVVPESVTQVKKYQFENCTGLTSVVIPDGVETPNGDRCFSGCIALENLTLGDKAYVWGGDLEECVNLKTISVSKDNPDLCTDEFGVVFNKDMTELVAAPKQMAADYQIPEGVTIIDGSAFSHSNLTSVTIPASVVEIKYEAFENCANLSQITFLGSAPEISYSAFSGVTATVEYPADDATWEEVVESSYWTEDTHLTWGGCKEHTVVTDEAVAATCTGTGLTEGSHCSECGTVLVAQETVDALGHSAGEWTFDETAHWRECTVCGEKLEWDEHTYEPGNDADCIVCDYTKSVGLLGDVDGSEGIDFFDGMYILQYYAGIISESELDVSVADVDGSGSIDFFDGMYVLQFYAGIITEYPSAG